MTSILKNLMFVPLLVIITNCQNEPAPTAPSRLSSDDAGTEDASGERTLPPPTTGEKKTTTSQPVSYKFGAPVGTTEQRQKVNACNESGMFFDRVSSACSKTLALVKGTECTREALLNHFDVGKEGMDSIDAFIAAQNGVKFHFDQCAQTDPNFWTIYLISDAMKSVSVCVAAPGPCPK